MSAYFGYVRQLAKTRICVINSSCLFWLLVDGSLCDGGWSIGTIGSVIILAVGMVMKTHVG